VKVPPRSIRARKDSRESCLPTDEPVRPQRPSCVPRGRSKSYTAERRTEIAPEVVEVKPDEGSPTGPRAE